MLKNPLFIWSLLFGFTVYVLSQKDLKNVNFEISFWHDLEFSFIINLEKSIFRDYYEEETSVQTAEAMINKGENGFPSREDFDFGVTCDNGVCEKIKIYCPVVATNPFDVICVGELDPVCAYPHGCTEDLCALTAGNSCEACSLFQADYYTLGACPGDNDNA